MGLSQKEVSQATEVYQTDSCPKGIKLAVAATYTDADWKPPLYDIWSWGKRGDQSEVARATGEVCETEDLPKSTKPSPHARAGGRSARRWGCRREPLPTMCQF